MHYLKCFFFLLIIVFCTNLNLLAKPASEAAKAKHKINKKAFQLCEQAIKAANSGDLEVAISYLKRALQLEPGFPEALFNLGSIYRVRHQYDHSYAAFQELLIKNPQDHEARLEKTLSLIGLGNLKQAQIELDKVPKSSKRYQEVATKLAELKAAEPEPTKPIKAKISKSKPEEDKPSPTPKASLYESTKKTIEINTPTGITEDPQHNIYVANFSGNTIEKLSPNGQNRQILATGNLLAGPSDLVFDGNEQRLLVCNYKTGTVITVDLNGKMRILLEKLEKPYALFLQNNHKLYISEQGKKAVSIVDLQKLKHN
jgi:tetratricopeptide (TPR) repeat protein